jgi:hypothetical protein
MKKVILKKIGSLLYLWSVLSPSRRRSASVKLSQTDIGRMNLKGYNLQNIKRKRWSYPCTQGMKSGHADKERNFCLFLEPNLGH